MSMFELVDSYPQNAVIKVIGIGGGGGNAVEHMLTEKIEGVEFICANTDAQALKHSSARTILQLGGEITKGLGAGSNPDVGRRAAEEDRERIQDVLQHADMVFITAGMGGGTGTGAAPVVAEIAREMGILTVAVVTKPFSFEGKVRHQVALRGIQTLTQYVDSLITIPNDKLLSELDKNLSLLNAFKTANNVLLGAVQGIAELITRPGLINVDFADVRTVMAEMGMAMMGTGEASGDDRAEQAAKAAVASPLLEDVSISGARGILVNVTAGPDLSIGEFETVGEVVKEFTSEEASVVVGTVIDPDLGGELRVTVVVTGLGLRDVETGRTGRAVQGAQTMTPTLHSKPAMAVPPPVAPLTEVAPVVEEVVADASAPLVVEESPPVTLDMDQLNRPTILRQQASRAAGTVPPPSPPSPQDVKYLDIPAFLRRKEGEGREEEEA